MTLTKKEASSKQEHNIADALGWKVTSGSGARAFYLGDVSSDAWLGECKTHLGATPVLFYWSVWDKIVDEAASQFKRPVLFVDNGTQDLNTTWCMTNTILDYEGDVYTIPEKCIRERSVQINSTVDRHFVYQYPNKEIYFIPFNIFKEMIA